MTPLFLLSMSICLVAVAATHFASASWSVARAHSRDQLRRCKMLQNYRSAAEIVLLDSQLQQAAQQAVGVEWRVMEVGEVVEESHDCRSFYLVDPYGQALPAFRPGQYVMVRPAIAGNFQATRCYSLSSAPDSRYWRITVKRHSLEPGRSRSSQRGLSGWLHDNIRAGDCLLVGGPAGHFFLPAENQKPLVLLAAGVGITPMASMLRWSLEHMPHRPVVLLYQARDLEHWPLGMYLHQWVEANPNCSVTTFFSRLAPHDHQRLAAMNGSWVEGKFTAADVLIPFGESMNICDYYMCGPDAWMESMRSGLIAAGIPEQRVHWESFGGAAWPSPADATHEEQCQVRFVRSGVEASWNDPETSLWELAKACEVHLPSGCLSGVCGSCRVKVSKGEVAYDRPVSIELAAGECLSCVARPASDLEIEA